MSETTFKTKDSRKAQAELTRLGLTEREAQRVIYGVDDSGYWEDPGKGIYVYRDHAPLGGCYEVCSDPGPSALVAAQDGTGEDQQQ